jgi:hypothetical protein
METGPSTKRIKLGIIAIRLELYAEQALAESTRYNIS